MNNKADIEKPDNYINVHLIEIKLNLNSCRQNNRQEQSNVNINRMSRNKYNKKKIAVYQNF